MVVNPAGTSALVVNATDNTWQAYDLSNGLPVSVDLVPTGNTPWAVAVNPAGTHAFVINNGSNLLQTFMVGRVPCSTSLALPGSLRTQAYPDPSQPQQQVYVAIQTEQAGPATLLLTDALGRPVSQQHLALASGTSSHLVAADADRLAPGVYILHVQQRGRQQALKLVRR